MNQHSKLWQRWVRFRQLLGHPDLGMIDLELMHFIFDRTIGWSTDRTQIPIRHFTEGIWEVKDGQAQLTRGGIPAHQDTIYNKLVKLRELGLILVTEPSEPDQARTYEINFDPNLAMPRVKPPKRLQKFANSSDPETTEIEQKSQICDRGVTGLRQIGRAHV